MLHNFKAAIRTNIHVALLPFWNSVRSRDAIGFCLEGMNSPENVMLIAMDIVQCSEGNADIHAVCVFCSFRALTNCSCNFD